MKTRGTQDRGNHVRGILALTMLLAVGSSATVGHQAQSQTETAAAQQMTVDGQMDIVGGQSGAVVYSLVEYCQVYLVLSGIFPGAGEMAALYCGAAMIMSIL